MKKYLPVILSIFFINLAGLVFTHLFPEKISAQVCSGTDTYNYTTYDCRYNSFLATYECIGFPASETNLCSSPNGRDCYAQHGLHSAICTAFPSGCDIRDVTTRGTDGCYWTGGTTPPPTPGGGGGSDCRRDGSNPWCTGSCSGGASCKWVADSQSCVCMGGGGGPSCRPDGYREWWTQCSNMNCCNCCSRWWDAGTGLPIAQCEVCPPSCSVALAPASISIPASSTLTLVANVTPTNGTVERVEFLSSNPSVATVTSPATRVGSSNSYTTTLSALSSGSSTISARVVMGGTVRCAANTTANITGISGWWQLTGGSAITNGNLVSLIPTTCTLPTCNPLFIVNPTSGLHGNAIYGGTFFDFEPGGGSGRTKVSTTNWLANPPYLGASVYNYNYFVNLIPAQVTPSDPGPNPAAPSLNAAVSSWGGYRWFRRAGSLTFNDPAGLNTNNKIILFVDGNLTINTKININQQGRGFFMAIVGGNINIDPLIGNSPPDLEGILFSQGSINTGTGNRKLTIRGSLAALGGINLQRDLGAGNSTNPAEVVEFAPDLFTLYPPFLNKQKTSWREVLP